MSSSYRHYNNEEYDELRAVTGRGQYGLMKRAPSTKKHLIEDRLSSIRLLFEQDKDDVDSEVSFCMSSSLSTRQLNTRMLVQLKVVADARLEETNCDHMYSGVPSNGWVSGEPSAGNLQSSTYVLSGIA